MFFLWMNPYHVSIIKFFVKTATSYCAGVADWWKIPAFANKIVKLKHQTNQDEAGVFLTNGGHS